MGEQVFTAPGPAVVATPGSLQISGLLRRKIDALVDGLDALSSARSRACTGSASAA